jgi:photosystem II stability/assembly factor-like uncharacterized protein/Leucine-rich repeat (LRR) protein
MSMRVLFTSILWLSAQLLIAQCWEEQTTPTTSRLDAVFFYDANNGWAVGANGTVVRTTNGGTTWSLQNTPTTQFLSAVHFPTSTRGVAVGGDGVTSTVLRTTNGGTSWSNISVPFSGRLTAVHFPNQNVGYITGFNRRILKTTNGGQSWSTLPTPTGATGPFFAIHFVSATTGWVTGDNGIIWKTTNGGNTWSLQHPSINQDMNDLEFVNENYGWATGGNGGTWVLITRDGGTTWTESSFSSISPGSSLIGIDTGFVVRGNFFQGSILEYTSDGGTNWEELSDLYYDESFFEEEWINDIFFLDEKNGWLVGSGGRVIRRTTATPSCPNVANSVPANGQEGVSINQPFLQIDNSTCVEGYYLALSSAEQGVLWRDTVATGNLRIIGQVNGSFEVVSTATRAGLNGLRLPYETEITVTAIPYNWNGPTTTCPLWQFTTQPPPCTREADSLTLLDLFNNMNGPSWTYAATEYLDGPSNLVPIPNAGQAWDTAQPIDTWHGVVLSELGCVDKLILNGLGITGTIFDLQLDQLTELYLYDNALSGSIPDFTGMGSLEILDISTNQLNAAIPDFTNFPSLTVFVCNDNQLSGPIPDFSMLSNLQYLLCYDNNLSGAFPDFSAVPSLQYIDCGSNEFSGSIPNFTNLPNLTSFQAYFNSFSGPIPDFNACPQLVSINLAHNDLAGDVVDYSLTLADLRRLYIDYNQFTFSHFLATIDANEALINANATFATDSLRYAPQDTIFTDTLIRINQGQPLTIDLGIDEGLASNVYTWYKDGQPYTTINGDNELTFASIQTSDAGMYYVEVTNAGAPDLTLVSYPIVLEVLELNSSCVVTNNNDSGFGSLREAIICANDTPGADTISFSLSGFPPYIIQLETDLPVITDDSTVIDASSQPNWSLGDIIIDGEDIPFNGPGGWGKEIGIQGAHCSIYGLWIRNFRRGLTIGYQVSGGGPTNIGAAGKGNVFTNNSEGAIIVFRGRLTAKGNIIGLEPDGITAAGNRSGLYFVNVGDGSIIGGNDPGDRNTISANTLNAIQMQSCCSNISIIGNYIGTDTSGTLNRGNGSYGIQIINADSLIVRDNILSGNNRALYVQLDNTPTPFVDISANIIGSGRTLTEDMGNTDMGVFLAANATLPPSSNIRVSQNTIANNRLGVSVWQNTNHVRISQNEMYCNQENGILLNSDANANQSPPQIDLASTTQIRGIG